MRLLPGAPIRMLPLIKRRVPVFTGAWLVERNPFSQGQRMHCTALGTCASRQLGSYRSA